MIPFDPELQSMTNEELRKLWNKRTDNPDWVRVAKEIRHRKRFNKWEQKND